MLLVFLVGMAHQSDCHSAAQRADAEPEGCRLVKHSFRYTPGEHGCLLATENGPEERRLPFDDAPRIYRDGLQLEGLIVEKHEWTEEEARGALSVR